MYYALAVLVLLIAAGLRIWNLSSLPAGFSDLELSHIDVALDEVQRGDIRVFYEREVPGTNSEEVVGQEGLYPIVLAATVIPFGTGTFGLRFVSLLIGMITIALIYALATRLFTYRVGLITSAFYAVLMFPILLSRLVVVETALPLMIVAIMLSMVRALPVYNRNRAETSNTLAYAIMAILISMSLYLHQSSLFIVLMAMAFIIYILLENRPMSMRRLSYIGFAILLLLIFSMPYLLSTFRLPELGANGRIAGQYDGIINSSIASTLGLMIQGDANPLYNLPQRPLMDIISGIILIFGLTHSIRNWRNPSYAIILIAIVFLGPPAILADNSPNFLAMSVVLPIVALLLGVGAGQIVQLVPPNIKWLAIGFVIILWAGNLGWTVDSLYSRWANKTEVQLVYNSDIGQIAGHFDRTAHEIPVVICNPDWNISRARNEPYSDVELIKLHMNRDSALLREVDCRDGFVFVNAGLHQQVLLIDPMQAEELSPLVVDWLALGTVIEGLPDNTVIEMQVQSELEDALGVFTTTSPASYATETDISARVPVAPPIRFGGNITWLGYENEPLAEYQADTIVPVVTYWRIEGLVPSDLLVFTHVLSDPIFPAAQVDTIYIDPTQLRERDIYLHNANIQLQPTIETGEYVISVGAYQSTSDERLPVFIDESATQGNRIFLYQITIDSPDNTEN